MEKKNEVILRPKRITLPSKNIKICSKCKKAKRLSEFGAHRRAKGEKNPECKACVQIRNRLYWEKKKLKLKSHEDIIE